MRGGPQRGDSDIGMLLKEKLAVWSTSVEVMDYYRKRDNRDAVFILDKLSPFKIPILSSGGLWSCPLMFTTRI